jgi:hypothetical protein
VSGWATFFIGVIAVSTLATAIMQIGLLFNAGRLVRRIGRFVDVVERDVKPILGHLDSIGRDASHATALAAAQVERVDRVFTMLVERLEDTLETIQTAVVKPAREAAALVAGLRAALAIIRDLRGGRARSRADEEDALFI